MELSSCHSKRYVKINSIMTSIMFSHLQYCHIHTDRDYAPDHNEKIHRDDILTFLLITIMTKNHLNTDGVFL